jgi:PAS domain-containing protein
MPQEEAMTSPAELDRFLAELGGRRKRLSALMDSQEPGLAVLAEELTELGEQLIVADEELRVQQEELTAARQQVENLAHERDVLLQASAHPYVLTDYRGVVLRANRAAERLIRQPAARRAPRPIATWFEVADRPAIRNLITQTVAGQQTTARTRADIQRSDRTVVSVEVTVTAIVDAHTGGIELQWELETEPVADAPAKLRLVAEPDPPPAAERELITELALLATELGQCETEEDLLAITVERVRQLVPAADQAGVLLPRRRGRNTGAWTAEQAAVCDRQQAELAQGPAMAAMAERSMVVVADTAAESRWPAFVPLATEFGVRSMLAVDLHAGDTTLGVLSLYAARPEAFDDPARFAAAMLAMHVGVALGHLRTEQNLRAGLASRELIGEAIGVLIERRRITSEQAFQLLVRASQHSNIKLREVAQIVRETGQDPAQIRAR